MHMNLGPEYGKNISPSPKLEGSKIDEYIKRAQAGEPIESFGEIPDSWKEAIESGLTKGNEPDLSSYPMIPKDLESLMSDPDTLEEMWTFPEYTDVEKNKELRAWKKRGMDYVRKNHLNEQKKLNRENGVLEIERIKNELGVQAEEKPPQYEYKEVSPFDSLDRKKAVEIYNAFAGIANNLGEGLKNSFTEKIGKYVNEIRAGANKERVIDGLPPSFVKAIEEELAKSNTAEKKEEPGVFEISGIENIKKDIENISKDHFLFTHITDESIAKEIYGSSFEVSMGTGISSTMTLLGENGVNEQIEKILKGESPHRGYNGMIIIAIPKSLFNKSGDSDFRFKPENLEDYLIENDMYKGSKFVIPQEFNYAYLNGDTLYKKPEEKNTEKVSPEDVFVGQI